MTFPLDFRVIYSFLKEDDHMTPNTKKLRQKIYG